MQTEVVRGVSISCVGTILQSGPISRDSSRDVLRVLVMFTACLEIGGCIQICVFVFGEDEGGGKYDRETRVTAHKEDNGDMPTDKKACCLPW